MQFLVTLILLPIAKWIMTKFGQALYEYVTDKIKEHDQEKANRENLKKHKEAIEKAKKETATEADKKERLKTGRDLINGTEKK